MPVVSDSSPLIALATIDRLPLLSALFDSVVVPPAVAFETRRSIPDPPAWLRTRSLEAPPPPSLPLSTLGDGEREAIALALETGIQRILLDDLPARRVAHRTGLQVIGTLGLVLAAKRKGLISEARPELNTLISTGFFMSPPLYEDILRAAGEL